MIVLGSHCAIPDGAQAIPMHCSACDVRTLVVMPVHLRTLAAMVRAFEDAHCECAGRAREERAS